MAESPDLGIHKTGPLPPAPPSPQEAAPGRIGERTVHALPTYPARMQEVNQTIVKLTKAVESLRALHDELQNCSAEERAAKIEATRKICPVSLEISLEETGTTLQKKIYNLESRLKNVRHYRDLLSSSAPRGTLKTYGLGDKEIVDLTLP